MFDEPELLKKFTFNMHSGTSSTGVSVIFLFYNRHNQCFVNWVIVSVRNNKSATINQYRRIGQNMLHQDGIQDNELFIFLNKII